MEYKLSILIPTLSSRADQCMSLVDKMLDQVEKGNYIGLVEIVTLYDDGEKSIGTKRNELIQMAKGEYVCFIDDDDDIAINYIYLLMEGIEKGVDCCSLRGVITWDGTKPEFFEHSIRYNSYSTTDNMIKYERFPNHLNCIKKSIANQIIYPEINHGEDTDFAHKLYASGLIKTEHYIDNILYHYKFITNK